MTARQHLIRTATDLKGAGGTILAVMLGLTGCIALVILVLRGDPKGLGDWGLIIGLFLGHAVGLLTESRQGQRATDPAPGLHVTTRTTTETEPAP
jgi:hypothetical protein